MESGQNRGASLVPIIGTDLPWALVGHDPLRMVDYAPLAKTSPGADLLGRANVKSLSSRLPYALLEVEPAPIPSRNPPPAWGPTAIFPVFHREDFRAVEEAVVRKSTTDELFVFHAPIKLPWYMRPLRSRMPSMILWLCLEEFWATYWDRSRSHTERQSAYASGMLWKYEPLYDRFQGRWGYEV